MLHWLAITHDWFAAYCFWYQKLVLLVAGTYFILYDFIEYFKKDDTGSSLERDKFIEIIKTIFKSLSDLERQAILFQVFLIASFFLFAINLFAHFKLNCSTSFQDQSFVLRFVFLPLFLVTVCLLPFTLHLFKIIFYGYVILSFPYHLDSVNNCQIELFRLNCHIFISYRCCFKLLDNSGGRRRRKNCRKLYHVVF